MSGYKNYNDLDVDDAFVLPEGSVTRGQLLFKKHCSQCHTIRRDGCNPYGALLGPNLYGVMGRTAAQNQRTGLAKYSDSLQESGILWTEKNMVSFLKNPRAFAGGVINMNFRGIDSFKDRCDVVHYLKRAGHESWMVVDGSPHSQKGWWNRDGGGKTQSYWEANVNEKHLKPWQHITRAVSAKVNEFKDSTLESMGLATQETGDENIALTNHQNHQVSYTASQEDKDVVSWRRAAKVVDGVHSASMENTFNWPLSEEISAGPIRRAPVVADKAKKKVANAKATAAATAVAAQQATSNLVFCDERVLQERRCPALPGGERAPSGLMVYSDHGGPRAKTSSMGTAPPKAMPLPAANQSPPPEVVPGFVKAASFQGRKENMVFKIGSSGLGYYPDVGLAGTK